PVDFADPDGDEEVVFGRREVPPEFLERYDRQALVRRPLQVRPVHREGGYRIRAVVGEAVVRQLGERPGAEDDQLAHGMRPWGVWRGPSPRRERGGWAHTRLVGQQQFDHPV